ncbi:hypothetical protein SUGI_1051330 [Cryptomeria japonica]|nr:hypothetical protein SUGI_1051330 [Cryptomeria japonica]
MQNCELEIANWELGHGSDSQQTTNWELGDSGGGEPSGNAATVNRQHAATQQITHGDLADGDPADNDRRKSIAMATNAQREFYVYSGGDERFIKKIH